MITGRRGVKVTFTRVVNKSFQNYIDNYLFSQIVHKLILDIFFLVLWNFNKLKNSVIGAKFLSVGGQMLFCLFVGFLTAHSAQLGYISAIMLSKKIILCAQSGVCVWSEGISSLKSGALSLLGVYTDPDSDDHFQPTNASALFDWWLHTICQSARCVGYEMVDNSYLGGIISFPLRVLTGRANENADAFLPLESRHIRLFVCWFLNGTFSTIRLHQCHYIVKNIYVNL